MKSNEQGKYYNFLSKEVALLEEKINICKIKNKEYLEDIVRVVSRSYQYEVSKATKYLNLGLKLAKELKELDLYYILRFHEGHIAFKKFENNQALEIYLECQEHFKIEKSIFYYHTLHGIAEALFHLQEFNKSKAAFVEVINYFESTNNEQMILSKSGQFVNLLYEMSLFEDCEHYNNRMFELSIKYKDYTRLSFAYLMKSRLNLINKDEKSFLKNINKSIEISKDGYMYNFFNSLCIKAEFFYSKRRFEEMKKLLDEIIARNDYPYISGTNLKVYEMLYSYFEKKKKYKEANQTLKLIFELKNNISISKSAFLKFQNLNDLKTYNLKNQDLYISDIFNNLVKIEVSKIIEINYDNRICTFVLSTQDKIQKYSSFNECIKLLNSHSESPDQFFKINSKNKAINLIFFKSLNESLKTISLKIYKDVVSYPISVRQIAELKKQLNILK